MYADQAATSRPCLYPPTGDWANPSAEYPDGRHARAALDDAKRRTLAILGLPPTACVWFTSGGTEGNNLVLQQPAWQFIITGRAALFFIEGVRRAPPPSTTPSTSPHSTYPNGTPGTAWPTCRWTASAVSSLGPDRPVRRRARCSDPVETLQRLLFDRFRGRPGLVSLMYVNNETGVTGGAALGRRRRCPVGGA